MWWLAVLECSIGVGFLLNAGLRVVSLLFLLHMVGTFLPLFVLPELAFRMGFFAPTLEGQYILKNLVFVAAGWTVLLPHCLSSRRASEPKQMNQPSALRSLPGIETGVGTR